jgi:hypothetical protein
VKIRIAAGAALLGCLCAQAGEIVIVAPAETSRGEREPTRSERELGRTIDKARQYGGKGGPPPLVIEEGAPPGAFDKTEQSIRDAQHYLRSGGEAPATEGTTTIILRSAPLGDAEKLRQKARAQVAPPHPSRNAAPCASGMNTVGVIGEGASAERSNVVEKGNSAVNTQCK